MYYKVLGKGKVVMLVHGFIEDGRMWDEVAKALSKKYKVIVPDLPGFGNQLHDKDEKLSMEYYAEHLLAILKEQQVKQLIMLGHSMGGYVTLYFAEKYGHMLAGFGLINSHCFADSDTKKSNRLRGIDFIGTHGTLAFVTELYNNIFHTDYKQRKVASKRTGQHVINDLIKDAGYYDPRAVMLANEGMMNRKGQEDVLKNAKVPVLFINGKQDESAPLEATLKQASFPPVADVHFFNRSKHMSVFENTQQTIKAIEDYCSRAKY